MDKMEKGHQRKEEAQVRDKANYKQANQQGNQLCTSNAQMVRCQKIMQRISECYFEDSFRNHSDCDTYQRIAPPGLKKKEKQQQQHFTVDTKHCQCFGKKVTTLEVEKKKLSQEQILNN